MPPYRGTSSSPMFIAVIVGAALCFFLWLGTRSHKGQVIHHLAPSQSAKVERSSLQTLRAAPLSTATAAPSSPAPPAGGAPQSEPSSPSTSRGFLDPPAGAVDEAHALLWTLGMAIGGLTSHGRKHWSTVLALWAAMEGPPGDFVETGTYDGATTVLMMRALQLKDPNATRKLWAADSFRGLPEEQVGWSQQQVGSLARQTSDGTCGGSTCLGKYSASRQRFEDNMKANDCLDNRRLRVLEGWFNETLPAAPIKKIAFLRLDGDLFVSTMDALNALYHKMAPGGFIFVDDYGSFAGCRAAIDKFRKDHGITAEIRIPDDYLLVPRKKGGRTVRGFRRKNLNPEGCWWRVPAN